MRFRDSIAGRNPRATVIRVVTLAVIAGVLFGWVLIPLRLSGISMQPTYESGTLNFANRAAYWFGEPARGDVVAIRMAGDRAMYVKRIVALPGERVEIIDGTVVIDGVALEEPTVERRGRWNLPPVTVGAGEYFVVGDNRSMPIGQHDFGRVGRNRIVGKLLY